MRKPIARDWNEMTLGMWTREQEIVSDRDTDQVDKNVRLVALMYGMTEEEAYNTELGEFGRMLDGIGWLNREPRVPEVAPAYNLDGTPYVITLNPQKITTAQYIDFKSFDLNKIENYPLILSTIMIPSGHSYNDGYEIERAQEDIREFLRVPHALAIARFFFLRFKSLTLSSLRSLTRTLRREARRTRNPEELERIRERIRATGELERMFGSL